MKLCKDCKWWKESPYGAPGELDKCLSPKNIDLKKSKRTCLVVGKPMPIKESFRWGYCDINRAGGWIVCRLVDSCGKEGRWWEAIE